MIRKLHFYLKIFFLLLSKRLVPKDIIKNDYNSLAPTYDNYFSNFTKPHSSELVKRLNVANTARALDLACGTGIITSELRKYIARENKITAVDYSDGMINKAKEKAKENIEFICKDMIEALDGFESESFDCVCCGWAIGYSYPLKMFEKIKRVLKHNGKLGIIENRFDTLLPLRETGIKVMQRYPGHIRHVMDLPLRLPKSKDHLRKLYIKAGLKPLETWEGEINFNFKNGTEVLNWALHTGASAGFDRIMDPAIRDKCDNAFIEIIEKDHKTGRGINIAHRYVAGIAQKA
ncbi:MAG: class I SAM-dependent methyltransferase [Candidatus Omnitrophota bacterium]